MTRATVPSQKTGPWVPTRRTSRRAIQFVPATRDGRSSGFAWTFVSTARYASPASGTAA